MAETLNANALITWERLMTALDLVPDDQDAGKFLINAVSDRANSMTRRKLKSRTYTNEVLDGTGTAEIILPEYPVTAIAEVRVDRTRAFADASIVDPDDYEHDEATGILFIWTKTPAVRRCVRVTFTAGYGTVPDDLQRAVVEAAAYGWKQDASRTLGVRSVTGDGVTTQYEIDIPIPAKRVIESYAREPRI